MKQVREGVFANVAQHALEIITKVLLARKEAILPDDDVQGLSDEELELVFGLDATILGLNDQSSSLAAIAQGEILAIFE